jgi:hypothetical protein
MNNVVTFINTGMEYIKKYNPLDPDLLKTITKFNVFSLKPNDVSDATIEPDPKESFDTDTPADQTDDTNPFLKLIIDIILYILYYISILLLASIVANDLIFMPWVVRLFAFCFVLSMMRLSGGTVFMIGSYYTLNALYNAYINFRDKPLDAAELAKWTPRRLLPRRYGFLPLMTSRGWRYDFLNPFSYFDRGEDMTDPKYANYKNDVVAHENYLKTLVPKFAELEKKSAYKFKELLEKFNNFIYEINESFYNAAPKATPVATTIKTAANETHKAVEEQVMGAILKATGPDQSKEYIKKTLGASV